MKNFLTLIFAALLSALSLSVAAQTDKPKHLEFMGIPIDGNVNSFVAKLQAKGLKFVKWEEGSAIMSGDFIGRKCFMVVFPTPKSKTTHSVIVIVQGAKVWSSLKSQYDNLVRLYTDKYGEPDEVEQTFKSPFHEGDGFEILSVQKDRCSYKTTWRLDENKIVTGTVIAIGIDSSCDIMIGYADGINLCKHTEEQQSDI
ncbi:MAG: hypothetical protein LBH06_07085 [Rikenellaceae bacterium]|jgi:hypothetical protein|nr:hypothetical protein [Rikenellaceae bacterium]